MGESVGSISNSGAITCINVQDSTVNGSITNTGTGTITANGGSPPTTTGITINNSAVTGSISNAGIINAAANGILTTNNASVFDGISNSGTISSGSTSIFVKAAATFSGGIANSGRITAQSGAGIFVGTGLDGGTLILSIFAGGISNSGTIFAGDGFPAIQVGGAALGGSSLTILSFSDGISNSGVLSSLQNGIFVGGTAQTGSSLTISNFAGGISNSGTISVLNNGIFVGGTGAAGSPVTVSTFAGGITNSGTILAGVAGIAVGATAISTFSGNISNSGTIVANTGIVVGTGVSTFLGAIVNSGTIIGNGGPAISVANGPAGMTIDILGGAITGNIVGAGLASGDTLNFALGSGTFTYNSNFINFETVNINSGTVVLNGTDSAATVNVNAGGTLAGTGTIDPAPPTSVIVNAGGTLEPGIPGTPGGALGIDGNLTFDSGAYEVQLSPTLHGFATVSGNLSIGNGTVVLAPSGPYGTHYSAATFSILTYGGTLTGTFNPNVTYAGTVALSSTPTISYVGDSVDLSYSSAYADLATVAGASQNQQNVINAINTAIVAGGTVPAGFQQLIGLSIPAYLHALTQLDGEDATGAQTGAFTLMSEFLELMLGQSGGGENGGSDGLGFAPQQAAALPPDIALAYASILKAQSKVSFDQRWSAWASGFGGGSIADGDAAVGSNDVTTSTYGTAAGMEYRADPNTFVGLALAGAGFNWGLAQGLGSGRSDAFQAGVYGRSTFGPAYIATALAFANNWFTTNRTALGDQLTARFQGQSYAARLEGGYRFAVPMDRNAAGVTPYAAIQAQDFHTPAYSETDLTSSGFGLSYAAMNGTDTRSELGARFDDFTALNNAPLILRARLAWAHDWVSNPSLNASFEPLPGASFTVNGAPIPHDSALASAGAQFFFTPSWSFLAKFDGEFAPTSQTYAGSGTLRYTW